MEKKQKILPPMMPNYVFIEQPAGRKQETREYHCWQGLKARVKNTDGKHQTYIEKGIKVCQRWDNSFEAFLEDMGYPPSNKHSVDRKDNDKHYSCGKCSECLEKKWVANCRWATQKEQNRNYSQNTFIEHDGKRLCLAEWTEIYGYKENLIGNRLKAGWPIEAAITKPPSKNNTRIGLAGTSDNTSIGLHTQSTPR